MKVAELAAKLDKGERLLVKDVFVLVLSSSGKVEITYVIDPNGDLWPIAPGELSKPPAGCHKIVNQYWDPILQKVVVEIDTNPV